MSEILDYEMQNNERSEQQSRLRNTEIESNAWSTPSHFRNARNSHNRDVTNESLTEKRITFGSNQQQGHYETSSCKKDSSKRKRKKKTYYMPRDEYAPDRKKVIITEYLALAEGHHSWADLKYFKSWSATRHARTHIFCGALSVIFGLIVVIDNPIDYMYGEEILFGFLLISAGTICLIFKHPKFIAFICLFTSLAAIALITRILVLFNIESERLVEIWRTRDAVAGLWACLGCLIVASFEVLLGVSSCSAGLRYSDLVDKFKARNIELDLAIQYPEIYGHLISKWSSSATLDNDKSTTRVENDDAEGDVDEGGEEGDNQGEQADADVDNAAELDAEMEMAMAEFDIGKIRRILNQFFSINDP